ncbi:MAG TPA: metalloregulator ArsR/SmtB family transcription factor [Terriglobales bacterium]|nr:metalloregulator ArsR/SmtB family transcription factor [Terriglobales bacterium]
MDLGQVEKVAKALADATRLKLYEYIAAHDQVCCGALVELRGVTPATVSHHLKILSEAGLITCRREGQFVKNQANPEVLEEFAKSLKALTKKRRKK